MKKRYKKFMVCTVMLIVSFTVFAAGIPEARPEKPVIAVSIIPQQYFVERIADDLADVFVLVGEGQSPHSYEPNPREMERLSKASIWFLSGTDFEIALVPKVRALYPKLKIVDATDGIKFRLMEEHGHADHDHHKDHDHPGTIDRHTWLGKDPVLVMSDHIFRNVQALFPQEKEAIHARHELLKSDILSVFDDLHTQLAPLKGRTIFVYHPAFGYFLDEFGIIQEAVETGGKEPTPRALSELINLAREENAAAIFVQKQFPVATAETLAKAINAVVVPLNPLEKNWLENIQTMGDTLAKSLL